MTIADTIADLERKHAESTSGEWHRDHTTIYTDIDLECLSRSLAQSKGKSHDGT